ncbi:MAG TPA: response regulator transcription factor [Gammaproteobacteria bacterium]|nr:response regulator transcription factor [Gammaproteobacteria bacterium]
MRILLIEDDRETANYLGQGSIKQSGHTVDHAANERKK